MHSFISSMPEGNVVRTKSLLQLLNVNQRGSGNQKNFLTISIVVKFKGGGVGWPIQSSILTPEM